MILFSLSQLAHKNFGGHMRKNEGWKILLLVLLVAGMLWFVFGFMPSQNNGQNERPNVVDGYVKYKSTIDMNYVLTLEDANGEEFGQWKCMSMAVCQGIKKGDHIRFNPSPAGYVTGYSIVPEEK